MNAWDMAKMNRLLPSKDMRKYLWHANLSAYVLAQIIYGAPCRVEEKLLSIKVLYEQGGFDEYSKRGIEAMISCMEKALKAKDEEGIFSLETCFYDEKAKDSGSSFEYLYPRYDDAIRDIKESSEYYADDYGELFWFEITKWGKDKNGKLCEECTYFIVGNELRYINISLLDPDCIEDMIGTGDLNLPVPFEAGDIVEINGSPFAPKFHALILDIGDNSDCCCVQGLAKDSDGLWNTGAVKHGMIGVQPPVQPSMLYTIERYNEALADDEKILEEISSYMKQGPDKAYELYEKISSRGGLTDDELMSLL